MPGSLIAAPSRPQSLPVTLAQQALACTFFAAVVAVCARIAIFVPPITPVPFTLQPLAIMLTGMFLGSWGGFFALLEYLAAGALGAPVFAGGEGGIAYMAAVVSLGYLFGSELERILHLMGGIQRALLIVAALSVAIWLTRMLVLSRPPKTPQPEVD